MKEKERKNEKLVQKVGNSDTKMPYTYSGLGQKFLCTGIKTFSWNKHKHYLHYVFTNSYFFKNRHSNLQDCERLIPG